MQPQQIITKRIGSHGGERAGTPSTSLNSSMALGSASTTRRVGAQLVAKGPILGSDKKKENKPIIKSHNRNLSQQFNKAKTPTDSALLETAATPYPKQQRTTNLATEESRGSRGGKESFVRYESRKVNQTHGNDGERIKLKNLTSLGQARDTRNEQYEEIKERNMNKAMKSPEKEVRSLENLAEKERILREKERKLLELERELNEKDKELRILDRSVVSIKDKDIRNLDRSVSTKEKEVRGLDRSASMKKENSSRYPGSMTFKGESKESNDSKNSNLHIPLREADRDVDNSRYTDSRYMENGFERIPSRLTPMARETDQSRTRDYIDESRKDFRRGESYKDDSTRKSDTRGILQDFDTASRASREEQRSFTQTQNNQKRDRYNESPYLDMNGIFFLCNFSCLMFLFRKRFSSITVIRL